MIILLKTFLLCTVIYESLGVISFNDMKRNLLRKIPMSDKKAIFFQNVTVDLNTDGFVDNYEVGQLFGKYWTPEDIDFFLSHCEEIGEDDGLTLQEFYMSFKIFSGYFRRCGQANVCPVRVNREQKKEL